jgi:hypothetical protein
MTLTVVDHPLVQHKLTLMRNKSTPTNQFRQLLREISHLIAYEVTRNLPLENRTIETPMTTMQAPVLAGKKLALVSILPKGFAIEQSTLMHNKLYLVAKKDKLKGKKIKSPKDLEKLTLLFRENGSATRTAMEAYLKKYKVQASQNMELTSNEAIKQAVLAGLGCSIMPLIGIGNELMRGDMEIVEMKGLPMVSDWNLIWLKSKSLSPAAEAYLKYIEEKKEAIIETHFAWYTKF